MATQPQAKEKVPVTVGRERYQIIKRIGAGSFGEIFLANDTIANKQVAVKFENRNSPQPQLKYEGRLYKILGKAGGTPGFAKMLWYGHEGNFDVLVMELLGHSLEALFVHCGNSFSMKTVLMLADQMLRRIWDLHRNQFVHRDIKPDNFLIGPGKYANQIYMIDFGLVKKFYDSHCHRHILFNDNKSLTGTARYASINNHLGKEQSRRDDLECLGYVLLYFLHGKLPWQGLKADNRKEKYQKIIDTKQNTPIEVLCQGLPYEFAIYLNYCRALRFEEEPDIPYLLDLFRTAFQRLGYGKYDYIYDWMIPKEKRAGGAGAGQATLVKIVSLDTKQN